ncbi:pitrilysin family protein [Pseudomonas sp. AL 58]|uniref:M16 family metallopeptidase n=1 Tax=Pseudomonas sp. AL 58 TaxID=3104275 RepID=UPI002ECC6E92|nr:pitrilysin family protein [Pseudomonas sp. AL 58]
MNNLKARMRHGVIGVLSVALFTLMTSTAATATDELFGGLTSPHEIDLLSHPEIKQDIQTWRTDAGTQVLFVHSPGLPMFDLVLKIDAGSVRDGDTPGLSALTVSMLNEGTKDYNTDEIAELFERHGAKFSTRYEADSVSVSLRSLSAAEHRIPLVELFAEVVGKPALGATQLQRLKGEMLNQLNDDNNWMPFFLKNELYAQLFRGHPYAQPSGGTPEGIAAVTREALHRFHSQTYTSQNMVIALIGDLALEEAKAIAETVSQALPEGPAQPPIASTPEAEPEVLHFERPNAQTDVMLAFPSVTLDDPDYVAMEIASILLGNHPNARLTNELRHKRGLTYGVVATFMPFKAGGSLQIKWDVEPRYNEASQALVSEMLETFLRNGPTQEELDLARQLFRSEALNSISVNALAVRKISAIGFNGRPLDDIQRQQEEAFALTPEAVRLAVNRKLDLTKSVFISVGPEVPQEPLPDLSLIAQTDE